MLLTIFTASLERNTANVTIKVECDWIWWHTWYE